MRTKADLLHIYQFLEVDFILFKKQNVLEIQ